MARTQTGPATCHNEKHAYRNDSAVCQWGTELRFEMAEPPVSIESSDPLFDDLFPPVREGNREIPFLKSRVYQAQTALVGTLVG